MDREQKCLRIWQNLFRGMAESLEPVLQEGSRSEKPVMRKATAVLFAIATVGMVAGLVVYRFEVRAAKMRQLPPPPSYFPSGAPWTQDVSNTPVDPNSAAMIQWLESAGGWGGVGKMQLDTEIRVLQADASTPRYPFRAGPATFFPSSDNVESVPLPEGGGIEGQHGYQCNTHVSDCHLIVVDRSAGKLYEAWGSELKDGAVVAKFMGIWDLHRVYPPSGRGDQCTSADAAGLPIAPLLFNADELAAGSINHALRFTLPGPRIRARVFVHPATHAGGPSGPELALPMGAHLRLKSSFDMTQLSPTAQVVARALQKYGMYLADAGNMVLTAQDDKDTQTKYADLAFDTHSMFALRVSDFEVLKMDAPIRLTNNCTRNRF